MGGKRWRWGQRRRQIQRLQRERERKVERDDLVCLSTDEGREEEEVVSAQVGHLFH